MKAVIVQYTVKAEFVEQNKANIQKVMDYLQANPIEGMNYASFTDEKNPNTFRHINICKDEDTLKKISQVVLFKEFQMALKASGPVEAPKATYLNLVAAGYKL